MNRNYLVGERIFALLKDYFVAVVVGYQLHPARRESMLSWEISLLETNSFAGESSSSPCCWRATQLFEEKYLLSWKTVLLSASVCSFFPNWFYETILEVYESSFGPCMICMLFMMRMHDACFGSLCKLGVSSSDSPLTWYWAPGTEVWKKWSCCRASLMFVSYHLEGTFCLLELWWPLGRFHDWRTSHDFYFSFEKWMISYWLFSKIKVISCFQSFWYFENIFILSANNRHFISKQKRKNHWGKV